MTTTLTGKLEKIEESTTQKGKPFHKVFLNGDLFFCWSPKLIEGVHAGDEVELTTDDGEFPKVTALKKISGSETVVSSQSETVKRTEGSPDFEVKKYREELLQVFSECLQDAMDALPAEYVGNKEFVLETALYFFNKRARPQHYALNKGT